MLVFGIKNLVDDKPKFQRTYNLISERLKELGIEAIGVTGNVTSPISIRLANGKVVEYVGDVEDANSVMEFALAETLPLVFHINDDNFHVVFGSHIDVRIDLYRPK